MPSSSPTRIRRNITNKRIAYQAVKQVANAHPNASGKFILNKAKEKANRARQGAGRNLRIANAAFDYARRASANVLQKVKIATAGADILLK